MFCPNVLAACNTSNFFPFKKAATLRCVSNIEVTQRWVIRNYFWILGPNINAYDNQDLDRMMWLLLVRIEQGRWLTWLTAHPHDELHNDTISHVVLQYTVYLVYTDKTKMCFRKDKKTHTLPFWSLQSPRAQILGHYARWMANNQIRPVELTLNHCLYHCYTPDKLTQQTLTLVTDAMWRDGESFWDSYWSFPIP